MNILLIDNEDSFTRNLEHLLATVLGTAPEVVAYADFRPERAGAAELLVISPGPGHPREYPAYFPLLTGEIPAPPVLGICLGMQIVNEALGGETGPLPGCVHGQASEIGFHGRRVRVARYHSLHVRRPGAGLDVTARTDDGVAMAMSHASRPLLGYQFHPESFLTEDGPFFVRHARDVLLAR